MTTVTNIILRALPMTPEKALTVSEVAAATGMTSYNVSGKLSKLATYGVINKRPGTTKQNFRWAAKPAAAAAP